MLTIEDPGATRSAPGFRRRRRRSVIAVLAAVAVLGLATVRLFAWPAEGVPAHVSAIVMLNSPGDPIDTALTLARQHRAGYLLISQGTVASHYSCPAPVAGVRLVCFHPVPATTQGEAEFAARLAARHHWRSIAIVTITPQVTRARLRLERCFPGRVYAATGPIPAGQWPFQLAYQWGALLKALTLQRAC